MLSYFFTTRLDAETTSGTDVNNDVNSQTTTPVGQTNAILTDTVLKAIYIIIGSSSIIGNGFVVMVIFMSKAMRKSVTNTFIINQSLVDGLAGIFLILTTVTEDDGRYLNSLNDEVYCRAWLTNAPLWAVFMSSSFNLMAIAIERFIAVWKPVWHKTSFTRTKLTIFMIVCWVVGPSITFIYASLASAIYNGVCLPYGVPGQRSVALGVNLVTLQYFLPVVVFTFCYTGIYIILRRKQKQLHSDVSNKTTTTAQSTASRNIIKTMVLVCVCFVLCWTINQVYFLIHILGHTIDFSSPFYHFSVVAVFFNCCCNPFVYILQYKDFQKKLRALVCCQKQTGLDQSDRTPGTANSGSKT